MPVFQFGEEGLSRVNFTNPNFTSTSLTWLCFTSKRFSRAVAIRFKRPFLDDLDEHLAWTFWFELRVLLQKPGDRSLLISERGVFFLQFLGDVPKRPWCHEAIPPRRGLSSRRWEAAILELTWRSWRNWNIYEVTAVSLTIAAVADLMAWLVDAPDFKINVKIISLLSSRNLSIKVEAYKKCLSPGPVD